MKKPGTSPGFLNQINLLRPIPDSKSQPTISVPENQ